jgi:hypothetical protein
VFNFIAADNTTTTGLSQDQAMAAYAKAGFTGRIVPQGPISAATFAADEAAIAGTRNMIGGAGAVAAAVAALTPEPRVKIAGQTVNESAKARIETMNAAAKAAGFGFDGTLYAFGTDMMECGKDRFHSLVREYADQDLFVDVGAQFIAAVANEHRRDIVINDMSTAKLDADGWLRVDGRKTKLSAGGLVMLMQRFASVFPSARAWATVMSPDARAMAITDGFARLGKLTGTSKGAMLRVRDDAETGEPLVWACVGPSFPGRTSDADEIVRGIIADLRERGVAKDARGIIDYDRPTSRMQAKILYSAEHVTDPAVGDVFRGGIVASTRDDGGGKLRAMSFLERVRCINCTTNEASITEGERIHRGNGAAIVQAAVAAVARGNDRLQPIIDGWRELRNVAFALEVDGVEVTEVDAVFAAAVDHPDLLAAGLKDAGIGRDVAVEMLLSGWQLGEADGDNTGSMADLINAVTRAAQSKELDAFQRFAMERASGMLIPILAGPAASA